MKIKTVVVSSYPAFREGLKKVLGPDFAIISYFRNIGELLTADAEADLAILDQDSSNDLALLRSKRPSLAVLKLSLEDSTCYLYESGEAPNAIVSSTVQNLTSKLHLSES